MLRKFLLATTLGLLGSLGNAADDKDPAKPDAKLDKAAIFKKLDTDGDGYISKDEFKKFKDLIGDKFKDKLLGGAGAFADKLIEKMFEKLDTNSDGKISKEEFEKFEPKGQIDPEKLKELREKLQELKK